METRPPLEITPAELAALRGRPEACVIVDLREPWEVAICHLPDALHLPFAELADRAGSLPRDRPMVVVCHAGVRSLNAVRYLRECGFGRATSLRGGLDAWAIEIDPGMPRY